MTEREKRIRKMDREMVDCWNKNIATPFRRSQSDKDYFGFYMDTHKSLEKKAKHNQCYYPQSKKSFHVGKGNYGF